MTKETARLRAFSEPVPERASTMASAHMGASTYLRDIRDWQPGFGSADADVLPDLGMLVSRSRDITRNHGIAAGIQQTTVDNVIGVNLDLVPDPDYDSLRKTKSWAQGWARETKSLWRQHTDTFDVDAAGSSTFQGLLTQALRAGLVNGEALALPLWIPRQGSLFSTRMQLIESDRLSNPLNQVDTQFLRGGIEIDEYGRPLAYYIRKQHPGDIYLSFMTPQIFQWERVPAETSWGRKRFLHLHDRERTGQNRGKPILAPVLRQFKMLDHYERTELEAAIVNAMLAAFIETPLDSATISEMFGGDINSPQFKEYLNFRREYVAPLGGAKIIPLNPGDKMSSFMPTRPSTSFGPFTEGLLRRIGVAVGLPYELLMKDFSKSNYSSASAALIEAWRFFAGRRKWLTDFIAAPFYGLWLEEAVNARLVDAPNFYSNRFAYCRSRWNGPAKGWRDPVKEAEAAKIRMENNLSTLEKECSEQGLNWEEVLEQRAWERQRLVDLGLPLPEVVGAKQPAQAQQAEDEEEGVLQPQKEAA
jgi:lambda family phage portal protein